MAFGARAFNEGYNFSEYKESLWKIEFADIWRLGIWMVDAIGNDVLHERIH